jgi:hypothetical protein
MRCHDLLSGHVRSQAHNAYNTVAASSQCTCRATLTHLRGKQVMSACGVHEMGQFYDTIAGSQDCVVRVRFSDFQGRHVFHCHLLKHEDQVRGYRLRGRWHTCLCITAAAFGCRNAHASVNGGDLMSDAYLIILWLMGLFAG